MSFGFWDTLTEPIIAPSPMDGVSDAAFRYITDGIGHPSLLMTEFTSVEGISAGITKLLHAFIHHRTSTPTIAQIFGSHPDAYYKSAFVAAEMGFDGVDINMGCPDNHVTKRGGGAALIETPELAKEIVLVVKRALHDWSEGKNMSDVEIHSRMIDYIKLFQKQYEIVPQRRILPVSIKTRIGFYVPVTQSWVETLLEVEPVAISIHGRTLKQMYTGKADWDEIGKAAELVRKTKTKILGNGDVKTMQEAKEKIKQYNLNGVLIGRACLGNPWLFISKTPTTKERLEAALEHCQIFVKLLPDMPFVTIRKHLAWYCKEFNGAHALKDKLMHISTIEEAEKLLKPIILSE